MMHRRVNGELIRTSIMGKTKAGDMLVSVNIKKLKRALFYTSSGEVVVTLNIACIQIDSNYGSMEYIAGNFVEARALARRIMNENIHFTDVGTFIELEMDYKTLNTLIEKSCINKNKNKNIQITPKDIQLSIEMLI